MRASFGPGKTPKEDFFDGAALPITQLRAMNKPATAPIAMMALPLNLKARVIINYSGQCSPNRETRENNSFAREPSLKNSRHKLPFEIMRLRGTFYTEQ